MRASDRDPTDGQGFISSRPRVWAILPWLLVFPVLYLFYRSDPATSHDVAETFSVVVSIGTFMLTWNARRFIDNHYFVFLGIAYLFVGILDLVHAHAFEAAFRGDGPNRLAQLWFAARYVQSAALLLAPLFVERKVRTGPVFAGFAGAAAILLASIFAGVFPDCYVRGVGLTAFKAASDYAVSGFQAAAIAALWRVRSRFDRDIVRLLILSILFSILAEMVSEVYTDAFVYNNLVGHCFKVVSFYLMYKALIETGLVRPYAVLFRNLKRREEEVGAARDELEARVAQRTAELRSANERLEAELAGRMRAERERELRIELLQLVNSERSVRSVMTSVASFLHARIGCEAVGIRYRDGVDYPYVETRGFAPEFVRVERSLCFAGDAGERGGEPALECLCGWVISGARPGSVPPFVTAKGTFWSNSLSELIAGNEAARAQAGRGRCVAEGYESLALVPLRTGDETFGLLQFADRRKDFFPPDQVEHLERIGEDIAVALARLLAREALRESEDRFRSLVEHSPVGILIVREGRVVFRNPIMERLLGPIPEGLPLREIARVHPDDVAEFERLCAAAEKEAKDRIDVDLRFLLSGGGGTDAVRWVRCQAAPVDHRGRSAWLVAVDDMTRVKDLEQIATAREKLAIIGQMAAGIAHEIRNPLSGINLNISTLEHVVRSLEEVSPERKERLFAVVAQAKAASDKIATVIRRVMDFTKPVPPKLGRVDVGRIVRDALEFSSVTLRKAGVEVETSLEPGLPMCLADPRLLEQVLLNLITNAIQVLGNVTGPRRLGLAAFLAGRSVVITVADNGPGVPAGLREKIFDPFYTTRRDGHGIGLSFSHRVVESHGGRLSVSDSRWGGAEFRIELPVEPEGSPA